MLVATIDFETDAIEKRPVYPPRPVGVSIKLGSEPSRYYAFAHASENNCSEEIAKAALRAVFESDAFLLFHHGKFDIEVMVKWLGLSWDDPRLHWSRMHDTEFLAFLCDPHALSHGLKDLAQRFLNWPPDEKDEIAAWCWENREALAYTTKCKVTRTKRDRPDGTSYPVAGNAMEFMPFVPGTLAGKYAVGDTDRTYALFKLMYEHVVDTGMLEAYERERELAPILAENERNGIRIDVELLAEELAGYSVAMERVESALRYRLNAPELNFDNDQEYAEALIRSGVVPEEAFELTPKTKKYRVGKTALPPSKYSDPHVASAIGYRNRLKTALSIFMEPWLDQSATRGVVSTNWNQTRGGDGGTRTGRPSTYDPNFLNISKSFEDRPDGYVHPDFLGVPKLPLVRRYMLPDEGHYWCHRDFSGQELRVFAEYEGQCWSEDEFHKSLLAAYLDNPAIDPHAWVRDNLQTVVPQFRPPAGATEEQREKFSSHLRTQVKVTNFRRLYGGGAGATAQALNISMEEAKRFCQYHDEALPGRKLLNDALVNAARLGEPIRTWGGRLYYVEEPKFIDGRLVDFYYKLINYLIQGSAADITKQAIIDWYRSKRKETRFLVTVYDEINISAPIDGWKTDMAHLKEAMCRPRLRCPMLSDGKFGPRWGQLEKCE